MYGQQREGKGEGKGGGRAKIHRSQIFVSSDAPRTSSNYCNYGKVPARKSHHALGAFGDMHPNPVNPVDVWGMDAVRCDSYNSTFLYILDANTCGRSHGKARAESASLNWHPRE